MRCEGSAEKSEICFYQPYCALCTTAEEGRRLTDLKHHGRCIQRFMNLLCVTIHNIRFGGGKHSCFGRLVKMRDGAVAK